MSIFSALVICHVAVGALGLIAFWVPVVSRKGGSAHRRWGRIAGRALMAAGGLAIAMALLSLYGAEQRLPMITDRALFRGLFGWMMLYLGLLTIGFADYGMAVARYRQQRGPLRTARHQGVFAAVIAAALNCLAHGLALGQPLMMLVAVIGLVAVATQLAYVWGAVPPRAAYVQQHFRSLLGMGISAYTAFVSVGLIRLLPDHVFNPLIWAVPSMVGVGLIVLFTLRTRPAASAMRGAAR